LYVGITTRPPTKGYYPTKRAITTTTTTTTTTTRTISSTTPKTTTTTTASLNFQIAEFEKRIEKLMWERDIRNKEVEFLEEDAFESFRKSFDGKKNE